MLFYKKIHRCSVAENGFSLAELSIVLVIVGLLAGGLLGSLSVSRAMTQINATDKQLRLIKEALLGYALLNGRLPCPASADTRGTEDPLGGGICVNPWGGFLPGITLGIEPADQDGYVLDPWGQRIRYAVSTVEDSGKSVFTQSNALQTMLLASPPTLPKSDLHICNRAAGISGSGNLAKCASNTELSNDAVALVFSTGKNGFNQNSADERANHLANRAFVSHTPSPATAAGGEFDDIFVWLSPNTLYHRLISSGRLQFTAPVTP